MPLYPDTDSPATIVATAGAITETIARDAGTYTYTGANLRVDPSSPFDSWGLYVATPGNYGEFVGASACLIGDYTGGSGVNTVEDEFADTYEINVGSGLDFATVTRISACQWTGTLEFAGIAISMEYDSTLYKWTINTTDEKDTDQSAPDAAGGSYASGFYVVTP